jgi:hypothetical protein
VKFKPLDQTPRFFRRKGLLKGGGPVRVQVVQHHRDSLRCRVVPIGQLAQGSRPVDTRAALGDLDLTPTREWLTEQKQMGHAVPFLFVILALWLTRGDGQSNPCFAHQLLAGLIPTDHRMS